MTRKERQQTEAKLDLAEHKAFEEFVDDLADFGGPEQCIWNNVKSLLKTYQLQLEIDNKEQKKKQKYKQGELPL